MISLTKDILVRGFDDETHAELGKKADQMSVSINSIVKDAVEQWLDKKTHVPHIHDLLIYSDEKSMNAFLKGLDKMANGAEWFKSFVAPPKHHTERILSNLNWHNETIKPYKPCFMISSYRYIAAYSLRKLVFNHTIHSTAYGTMAIVDQIK